MKLVAVAGVLSMAVAGCSWNDFWSQFDQGHHGGGPASPGRGSPRGAPGAPGMNAVQLFEGAIEHSPAPMVNLVSDGQAQAVRAELGAGQSIDLSPGDAQGVEGALQDGALSLLDAFLIARAIKAANFQLAAATTEGNAPGMPDERVAREVHDLLLGIVHSHLADCKTVCAGDATACGGRRSFGDGAPCAMGGQTEASIAGHFGPSWCVSGFCPALSQARE